ncbi:unnamed protein product [Dibothriocephalus latus]|uniref:Uncharacterized protein n=1 Tax=Dibothriocephalus latus TaxID=60516 RepID=A0A3P7MCB7_DIBLA|nr:unnamed protein product [Dibothriocephalus latus]
MLTSGSVKYLVIQKTAEIPVQKDFTATIVNSTTVRLTPKAPPISQPWGNKYLLTMNNRTFTKPYTVITTEETIINLQPFGINNVTLQTPDTSDNPFPAKFNFTEKWARKIKYTYFFAVKDSHNKLSHI